jgi:MFS family permease
LAQEGAYRWIFWINLPIVALGFIGVLFFLHLNQPVRSLKQIITETDWIGSVLFIASMTAFLIPISWGGVIYAWSSWRTLVPMILGICGLVAFCFYEEIFAKHPVIPIRIFRNSSTTLTYVIDVLQGLILL